MEQKFKVGDWVKVINPKSVPYPRMGKIIEGNDDSTVMCDFGEDFKGHDGGIEYPTNTLWIMSKANLELAYPSDHDLLDFASRDSKIAELTAKVSELEAELEKWKPKPKTATVRVYFYKNNEQDEILVSNYGGLSDDTDYLFATKEVTITEGEGM